MARCPHYQRVVAISVAFVFVVTASFAARGATTPPTFGGAQATTASQGDQVDGWLLTRHSPKASAASLAQNGCGACTWRIFRQCSDSAPGVASADGERCLGPNVSCGPGEQRLFIFFSPAAGVPLTQFDSYCFADGDAEIVTAASVMPDARRYASQVGVAKPTLRAWPPGGTTLVNLPTYFAASATSSAARDFGGEGYTMRIRINAADYRWEFGDGASVDTHDPGSGPPDGAVHHTYELPAAATVTVTVDYGATYSLVTPTGTIGPLPVDGGPVRSLPAMAELQVKEAIAGLTE
jgi:hypothetical protein